MKMLPGFFRYLFHRESAERDLDAEVCAHLDLLEDEKRREGLGAAEARRAARIELGGVEQVKEEVRSVRAGARLEQLGMDVRLGARQLRRNPLLTGMALLTLALGIGLNAAVFMLFNAVLLRPLQARDAQNVVRLYAGDGSQRGETAFSYPEYAFCRDQNSSFSGVAAFAGGRVLFTSASSAPEWLNAQLVSGNFFGLLGAVPANGRAFLPEEDGAPGAHPVAVISYGFWQSHFGGDTGVAGQTLNLNRESYTIVGVAPRDFLGTDPEVPDVWVPLAMSADVQSGPPLFDNREAGWLFLLARLKPGVPAVAAQAEMHLLAKRFDASSGQAPKNAAIQVAPATLLTPQEAGDSLPVAVVLLLAVALVLLIACANVANVHLARGVSRQKELGIRTSLGGSRARLIQQLVVESMVQSAIAGAAGLLIAWWCAGLALAVAHPPGARALSLDISPDWRVALYLVGVSLLSGMLAGWLPALNVSRQNPLSAMREESGAQTWRRGARLRHTLMVGQVAISIFLLVASGMLARALSKARGLELGFDATHVAVLSPDLRLHGYDLVRATDFYRRISERVGARPDVSSMALAHIVPLGNDFAQTGIMAEGREPAAGQPAPAVNFNVVSPEYFETLGITLVRGRSFTPGEVAAGTHVAVVSDALARQLWPGEDALGKHLRQGRKSPLYEVVGVAHNTRNVYLWSGALPYLYLPPLPENLDQYSDLSLVIRSTGDPAMLVSALPGIVREMDAGVTSKSHALGENLAFWLWPSRIGAVLAGTLGLLALLFASLGIAGVTALAVRQRTREIGIRMALGAPPATVVRLMLFQTGRLVAIGAAAGLIAAAVAARALAPFLYGLTAVDGIAFAGSAVLLAAATLAACYLPARRAATVDPMIALRHD
ncbi:MAG TPA: ABC transporter permease [Candidatus Acidoferrales bacterium]|nr:ABC transporter permease [Candidatus Acidoferrales bacterium]